MLIVADLVSLTDLREFYLGYPIPIRGKIKNEKPHIGRKRRHFYVKVVSSTRESLPQFENRIMARMYVRSIKCGTMYQSQNWRIEN